MLPGWAVIVTAILYLIILFGVANYGDRKGKWLHGRGFGWRALAAAGGI